MSNEAQNNDDLFDFPCDFPIKVMGETNDAFTALVVGIAQHHCTDIIPDHAVKTRLSRNGKYTSVTVTIRAHSREQLDQLYQALSGHAQVKMVL